MRRVCIQQLTNVFVLVVFLVLISSVTGNASGIFEMITPAPGSYLEQKLAELRARTDAWGPWNEDLVFADDAQRDAYRGTWEWSCHTSFFPPGTRTTLRCYYNYLSDRIEYQIYRAYDTCSRTGQSLRLIALGGDWDPAQYEKTTIYAPDTHMVTDKNAGSCGGTCDAMVPD